MLSLFRQLPDLHCYCSVPGVRRQSSASNLWTALQDLYSGLKQGIRLSTGWYLLLPATIAGRLMHCIWCQSAAWKLPEQDFIHTCNLWAVLAANVQPLLPQILHKLYCFRLS